MSKKTSDTFTVKLTVPIAAKPVLDSIAAYLETTPQDYVRSALYSHMECDIDFVKHEAARIVTDLRKEQP